jgi:hypothetical protein
MQEPSQMEMWTENRPKLEQVTNTFFKVLRATATDPENELVKLVPDVKYRGAFLNLARNLSPSGEVFDRIELRDASAPGEPLVTLASDSRPGLNGAIRKLRPPRPTEDRDEQVTMSGTLRAVHLDEDWLEIALIDESRDHVRISDAGEALDDVVGPMVNRKVIVTAMRRGDKYVYRDIEPAE